MKPSSLKVISFVILFLSLTVWGWSKINLGGISLREFPWQVSAKAWLQLALILIGIYAIDAFRYFAFARALSHFMTYKVCLRASLLNFLFAWISPGGVLGAPAASYEFKKAGVSLSSGLLICFGKSIFGSATILTVSAILLFAGSTQEFSWELTAFIILGASYVPLLALIPLGVFCPKSVLDFLKNKKKSSRIGICGRIWDSLYSTQEKLNLLLTKGIGWVFVGTISSLVYLLLLAASGTVLCQEFAVANFPESFRSSLLFSAFSYLMPTPSGAGFAEAGARAFFGSILSDAALPKVIILMRLVCFYSQIVLGFLYLILILGPRALREISTASEKS